jgi:hypothetical protein
MEDNNLRNTIQTWFAILAFFLMLWLMGGCKSSKVVSDRETKDSVVYTYKTIYRDSLRVKDSTVLVYETVQRDSVVLRVDKETGEVLSTDSWHWKDTNKDRDHVSEIKNKTEKSDSVATKAKNSVVVYKKEIPTKLAKKTHYGRTFFIGVAVGIGLSLLFKYRKKIFGLLVKYVSF